VTVVIVSDERKNQNSQLNQPIKVSLLILENALTALNPSMLRNSSSFPYKKTQREISMTAMDGHHQH
jgi:DNA-binding HxlR family transcriptional regulator